MANVPYNREVTETPPILTEYPITAPAQVFCYICSYTTNQTGWEGIYNEERSFRFQCLVCDHITTPRRQRVSLFFQDIT